MSEQLLAKTILKNKFWVVENQGQQVATIQATDNGVVLVRDNDRESFANIKMLSVKYNIHVSKGSKKTTNDQKNYNIYGFSTDSKPYNAVYNVKRRIPYFTKNSKSKSYYCAGYYAVQINEKWSTHFCPKSITVHRYPYFGPFRSRDEAEQKIQTLILNESN